MDEHVSSTGDPIKVGAGGSASSSSSSCNNKASEEQRAVGVGTPSLVNTSKSDDGGRHDKEQAMQLVQVHDNDKNDDTETTLITKETEVTVAASTLAAASPPPSPASSIALPDDWDVSMYEELEQELGWLEEEDMEAAVACLLDNHPRNQNSHFEQDHVVDSDAATNTNEAILEKELTVAASPDAMNSSKDAHQLDSVTAIGSPTAAGTFGGRGASSIIIDPGSLSRSHLASFRPTEILSPSVHISPATVPAKRVATRHTAGGGSSATAPGDVTQAQYDRLKDLMRKHYQLLLQQAILAVRAAHYHKYHRSRTDRTDFMSGGETADEHVEILDGAVDMLQDLDQNHKDAIRHYMQFHNYHHHPSTSGFSSNKRAKLSSSSTLSSTPDRKYDTIEDAPLGTPRSLFGNINDNDDEADGEAAGDALGGIGDSLPATERRLTRAQFNKSLQEHNNPARQQVESVFDIQGLQNLSDTFATIDKSVEREAAVAAAAAAAGITIDGKDRDYEMTQKNDEGEEHLLDMFSTEKACMLVLKKAKAKYDKRLVPGVGDVSKNFVDPTEYLGPHFVPPCDRDEETMFRRNRNLFTAGEDNLILRGVNLYGEKQWMLITDRFIPDRSVK